MKPLKLNLKTFNIVFLIIEILFILMEYIQINNLGWVIAFSPIIIFYAIFGFVVYYSLIKEQIVIYKKD